MTRSVNCSATFKVAAKRQLFGHFLKVLPRNFYVADKKFLIACRNLAGDFSLRKTFCAIYESFFDVEVVVENCNVRNFVDFETADAVKNFQFDARIFRHEFDARRNVKPRVRAEIFQHVV